MKRVSLIVGASVLVPVGNLGAGHSCTNLIVTKRASADGSVMITYTCDGEFHPRLSIEPAADHSPDEWMEIKDWSGTVRGKVKQVPHTYRVVDLMNEHQLVIGETTFTGREELINPDGVLPYWWLMRLALQRAKTAREAIEVIASLVDEYGYASEGESISIVEEASLMDRAGSRRHGRELPAHPGRLHLRARQQIRHRGVSVERQEELSPLERRRRFRDQKGILRSRLRQAVRISTRPTARRTCRSCVTRKRGYGAFSAARRLRGNGRSSIIGAWRAPHRIRCGSNRTRSSTRADVFALMRDHYEGTPYDMTKGVDAGPFGTPNRGVR